jgi:hypothetical protein
MKVFQYLNLISMLFLLCSWGEKGHQKINSTAPQFFPSGLNKFFISVQKYTIFN